MSLMTSPGSAAAFAPLKAARFADMLRVGCTLALFIAVFSGRFSLARFVDETARADWLELRLWFTGLAAVGWVLLLRHGLPVRRHLGRDLGLWLGLFALLYLYLMGNAAFLGTPELAPGQLADMLLIAVQAFLVVQIVRSKDDLAWFARVAEAVGVLLFLFCVAGFGNPELNGAGWAPFGGPTTFYRIEFLAFCCALYLFACDARRFAGLHLGAAGIALFSTFASLSKVAFLGGLIVVSGFLFWLLSARLWRQAVAVAVTAGLALVAFNNLRGEIFAARLKEAILTAPMELPDSKWTIGVLRRMQAGEEIRLADLPEWQQKYVRGIVRGTDLDRVPLQTVLQEINRVVVFEDNTGRARLWSHALELFRSHPWFGAGIGNYDQQQINLYSKQIESYRYPHNIVLEIAAAAGVIGLSLFALLVFVSFVLLYQRTMSWPALVYAAGYPLFILVVALAGGDYFDFRVFWLFALIVLAATSVASSPAAATHA